MLMPQQPPMMATTVAAVVAAAAAVVNAVAAGIATFTCLSFRAMVQPRASGSSCSNHSCRSVCSAFLIYTHHGVIFRRHAQIPCCFHVAAVAAAVEAAPVQWTNVHPCSAVAALPSKEPKF